MNRVEPKFLVAIVITVATVIGVVAMSLSGSDKASTPVETTTTTSSASTTVAVETIPPTTVEIPEDWYPKGSSRYSDRSPATTMSTLAPLPEDPGEGSIAPGQRG